MPDYMEDDEPDITTPPFVPSQRPPRGLKRKLGFLDHLFMAINPEAGQLLDRITKQQQQQDEFDYKRQRDDEDRSIRRGNLKRLEAEDAAQRETALDTRRKESFNTEMDVVKSGGRRITDLADLFTPREERIVSRAQGEAYAVPTQPMLAKRDLEKKKSEAQQALEAKVTEKRTMGPIDTEQKVAEKAALRPGELQETEEKEKIRAKYAPDRIIRTEDDDGTVRITGVPRKVSGTTNLGRVGKSKAKTGEASGDMSVAAERTMGKTQEAIDAVTNPKTDDVRSEDERKAAAVKAVEMAVAARPSELEGGVDKDGKPFIRPKARAATAKSKAGRVPVMRQANVAKAAQRKGMTPEQFTKWFQEQGGTIQ